MPTQTHATLHLFRHAGTAWREVARPWLADNDGGLRRRHVLVPTRGQAHGLKQRCLMEGVPRAGEMALVADEIAARLAGGAENIGVIFPRADAAHARLAGLLAERKIAFADMLGMTGAVSLETRAQRALLRFYERGGRLGEFLELWALLRATGFVTQAPGAARGVCESLFQERHAHELAACRELLAANPRAEWREVARVADLLLPAWPETLAAADALERWAR
jgi:hypothetical protein